MDKNVRNAIERATQGARKLLEEDFAAQLEGTFDILRDGTVAPKAGPHLAPRQMLQRDRIVAAIEHKRGAGMSAAEVVADYLRDAAFTTLNRFVALKMLEARELVQECITRGEQSSGYREFCGMAPGVALLPKGAGYRLYIGSLFDELSTEVKVLFDRRDPASVLWPGRATFEALLEILNGTELAGVWGEDETIGWVYQYFNGGDERRAMRQASQAPRNSRELAVRNQFFTPRYVVQFLTDNTLGRIWYEMRGGQTALVDRCEYMVRRPDETFAPRPKKDPRDIRVLDPACGSGHFLLYAFDLLLAIYEEAHGDPGSPESEATGETLAADYPSIDALRRDLPALILAHNLHGVDIDPRCAQIAQLALWMRAQRAFRDFGIGRAERPLIRRSNIVVAEPLVTDDATIRGFLSRLGDRELERTFRKLVDTLKLAGELGLLLRVEDQLHRGPRRGLTGDLFAPQEKRIRDALDAYAANADARASMRQRLFVEDAAQGVGLLLITGTRFDVVLMNPPFGAGSGRAKSKLQKSYPGSSQDLAAAFAQRAIELTGASSMIGALTTRLPFFAGGFSDWRERTLLRDTDIATFADLGYGVLDGALVEVTAWTARRPASDSVGWFASALRASEKKQAIRGAVRATSVGSPSEDVFWAHPSSFSLSDGSPFCYWVSEATRISLYGHPTIESRGCSARKGLDTADDVRFLRTAWEVSSNNLGFNRRWMPLAKGGEYSPFYDDIYLAVDWRKQGELLKLSGASIRNEKFFGQPGITYSSRSTSAFNAKVLPAGSAISTGGHGVFSSDSVTVEELLAILVSRAAGLQIELAVGGGDEAHSGSAARNYLNGIINRIHAPVFNRSDLAIVREHLGVLLAAAFERVSWDETSRNFVAPLVVRDRSRSLIESVQRARCWTIDAWVVQLKAFAQLDNIVSRSFGLDSMALRELDDQMGPLLGLDKGLDTASVEQRYQEVVDLELPQLIAEAMQKLGASRVLSKKAYIADRRFELLCRLLGAKVSAVAELERKRPAKLDEIQFSAKALLSASVGAAFGRWKVSVLSESSVHELNPDYWGLLQRESLHGVPDSTMRSILVDDVGHPLDLVQAAKVAFDGFWPDGDPVWQQMGEALLSRQVRGERAWLRHEFFAFHISCYSKSRRKAPIYWQLATPSASYSVWLYIHAFTKDTLYKVQNDYAAPKLAHEERKLESLRRDLGENPRAAERKALAVQESFIEELRAFLDEVKRVAPLWNPDLDDGVIINFAPLWRLVPHHKPWQKELEATWDALCAGKYDWAHLAIHLWPERVVPKCATDRSLAIAHGLEEVFWVEDANGKWKPRATPLSPIAELVQERTSPAVKAALQSLLDAPVPRTRKASTRKKRAR